MRSFLTATAWLTFLLVLFETSLGPRLDSDQCLIHVVPIDIYFSAFGFVAVPLFISMQRDLSNKDNAPETSRRYRDEAFAQSQYSWWNPRAKYLLRCQWMRRSH